MMKPISIWKQELADGVHTARLASLYCCAPEQTPAQAARYEAVLNGLEATFGTHAEAGLYSAPGRTEIGGNHTDHQQRIRPDRRGLHPAGGTLHTRRAAGTWWCFLPPCGQQGQPSR